MTEEKRLEAEVKELLRQAQEMDEEEDRRDPASRIMPVPGGKDFVQGYNAQAGVDSAHEVIVACEVINQPVDRGQAVPLVEQVRDNTGQLPREVSADAGYFSAKAVREMRELGCGSLYPSG